MATKDLKVPALAVMLLLSFPIDAFSAFIYIENNSFEAANLSPGGWNTTISGWTITGDAGSFNGTGHFAYIPDGTYTAWAHNGTITQTLGDVLTADSAYLLSVEIGHADNVGFVGYGVELWAGGTLLAADNNSLGDPGVGNWQTSTVSYTALSGDPLLGQTLSIRLVGQGQEADFDKVTLEVSSVPVPAAIWLFGSGLIGMAGISRRNKAG